MLHKGYRYNRKVSIAKKVSGHEPQRALSKEPEGKGVYLLTLTTEIEPVSEMLFSSS
jgi:hypothetical protein